MTVSRKHLISSWTVPLVIVVSFVGVVMMHIYSGAAIGRLQVRRGEAQALMDGWNSFDANTIAMIISPDMVLAREQWEVTTASFEGQLGEFLNSEGCNELASEDPKFRRQLKSTRKFWAYMSAKIVRLREDMDSHSYIQSESLRATKGGALYKYGFYIGKGEPSAEHESLRRFVNEVTYLCQTSRGQFAGILENTVDVISERIDSQTRRLELMTFILSAGIMLVTLVFIVFKNRALTKNSRALRLSREMLTLVMDNVPQAVFWKDRGKKYLGCNKAFAEMMNLDACEDVVGKTDANLLWSDDLTDAIGKRDERVMSTDMADRHVLEPRQLADGRQVWLDSSDVPLHDSKGKVVGILGSYQDITVLKKAESALYKIHEDLENLVNDRTAMLELTNGKLEAEIRQKERMERQLTKAKEDAVVANQAKGELLARTSHDLRTPIGGLIGVSELILNTKLSREQREYVQMMVMAAETLLRITDDIPEFARSQTGVLRAEQVAFSLRECISSAVGMLSIRAAQKGLELLCRVSPDVPDIVVGASDRLRQILVSLVSNAVKFTAVGQVMVVAHATEASEDKISMVITVTDTGMGIADDIMPGVLDILHRRGSVSSSGVHLDGMGLVIAADLAAMLGGRVGVKTAVAKGTTFTLECEFALADELQASQAAIDPETIAGIRKLSVLVADDNETSRDILQEQFSSLGVCCEFASDGLDALRAMQRARYEGRTFSAVVLDEEMPEMDGFVVAEKAKSDPTLASSVLMMLSSSRRVEAIERCRNLGVEGYLVKPVWQNDLLDALIQVLPETKLREQEARIDQQAPWQVYTGRPLRVLLVEDDPVSRMFATRVLEKSGHTVENAADGVQAVEMWDCGQFEVILMDIQMAGMTGLEAAAEIRRRERGTGKHIAIIATTARALPGDREECLRSGMDAYLTKPIMAGELLEQLLRLSGTVDTETPSSSP